MRIRKKICDLLVKALRVPEKVYDIESLTYNEGNGTVEVRFIGERNRRISVVTDSGTAMVRDIMKHLGL